MSNMPEPARDSKTPKVEGDRLLPLLEDRNRLKELLQLIESKRQEVSDEVFSRVREDYDARLESLNREISRQTKNFEATLKDYRNLIENLERAEEMVVESLEELKIRYALAEYTKDEFETITREKNARIDYYHGKIKKYKANMDRLESVLTNLDDS